jgi:hypothetical protein
MTTEKLSVIFRCDRDGSHVAAVFPTFPSHEPDDGMRTCYAHVGQHSACSRSWYRTTRAAQPTEYADLLAELTGIYDDCELVVRKRWPR